MKSLVVMNQKGGCGKTTVCCELVKSLQRTGTLYNFYDLDPQGGSIVEQSENKNAVITVVDTPGALTDNTADWIKNADVVVIPTRASSMDIPSLNRVLEMVQVYGKKDAAIVIVINQWTRWTSSRYFRDWLGESIQGMNAVVTTLPQSEMFLQAFAMGKSIVEYAPRHRASKATMEMVNVLRETAGLDKEQ